MGKNDSPAANAGTNQGGAGASSKGQNESSKKSTAGTAGLEVISTRDGFRRAGFAWSKAPTRIPLSELIEAQIKMLKDEPLLAVREVEIKPEAKDE